MSTSAGQKVTTDPASKQEIPEAVGIVTSDSLAAESLKGSGSFGEGNPHAAASKQPSHSTTTNNTDTSSATKLNPAVDAEAREAQEGWSETSQLNAAKGLAKDAGAGPTYASSAGASESTGTSGSTGASGSTGGSSGGAATTGVTGGYAGAADQARGSGELRPKGANLTEDPNLEGKTQFAEVGSEQDPARAAEQKLQLSDAQSGADAGYAKDTSAQKSTQPYSALDSDQAA